METDVIIAGGRDFVDQDWMFARLDIVHAAIGIRRVIEGGARGADTLGRLWAKARGIPVTTLRADWERLGKAAGYRRNEDMSRSLGPAGMVLIAPGDRGTQHMIDIAVRAGQRVVYLAKVGA